MAHPESHLRSASRPAPVRGVKHDRDDHLATDTPTTDPPASDTPAADAPTGAPQATGDRTPDAPSTDPSPPDPRPGGTPTAGPLPMGSAEATRRPGSADDRRGAPASWLGWGAFSGLLAGIAFLALNMWFAVSMGQDAAAPLQTIATIAEGPPPVEAVQGVGVVVHAVLSALFGLIFAALLLPLRRRSAGWLAWAGLLFGGAVYLVDFQFLGRSVPWFSAFQATNQPLELAAHLVFGSVLAALLLLAKPRTTSGNLR